MRGFRCHQLPVILAAKGCLILQAGRLFLMLFLIIINNYINTLACCVNTFTVYCTFLFFWGLIYKILPWNHPKFDLTITYQICVFAIHRIHRIRTEIMRTRLFQMWNLWIANYLELAHNWMVSALCLVNNFKIASCENSLHFLKYDNIFTKRQ